MNNDQRKLLHQKRGSGPLEDNQQEAAAFLLGQGRDKEEAIKVSGLTAEQLEDLLSNNLFFRTRIDYLTNINRFKLQKSRPQTDDDCLEYVKETLWKISRQGGKNAAKVRITALKALASVAVESRKNKPQQDPSSAPTVSRLSSLESE